MKLFGETDVYLYMHLCVFQVFLQGACPGPAGACPGTTGEINGMSGARRGRKERASPLRSLQIPANLIPEDSDRDLTRQHPGGYGEFKSLREIAVPQGDPAEQVPEVGGIFWQHPGAPDKPRQDPGDAPRHPR